MKPLNKEQQQVILKWLNDEVDTSHSLQDAFSKAFPASCCDSCADGHSCDSDHLTQEVRKEALGRDIKEMLDRNESEFDSNIILHGTKS